MSARNLVVSFEHITPIQSHQFHQSGLSSGCNSNGHLNMLLIHAQLETGNGVNAVGMLNGGSTSSSLVDALKPHSRDKVSLVFLDLHNYGSFSNHHNMGAPLHSNLVVGPLMLGYMIERKGQAHALNLATYFLS